MRKRSKYNIDTSKKGKQNRTYNNQIFDSELEMRFYKENVCTGLKDGSIRSCKMQVKYELQPKFKYQNKTILPINYIADFVITYADDSVIVVDVKGLPSPEAILKKKMFHYVYPDVDYRWISYSRLDGGWTDYEDIKKGRKERKKKKQQKGNK